MSSLFYFSAQTKSCAQTKFEFLFILCQQIQIINQRNVFENHKRRYRHIVDIPGDDLINF